jgi:hypothetical protein
LERKTLWLAPEQIADRDVPKVVELMSGYKRLLLDTRPTEGDDVIYNVIVVVFTDLSADRAQGVFGDVLQQLAVPSYVEDGILFGPYYEGNKGTAIFQSPVPFLFVRHGVTGATTRSHREPIRAAIESMKRRTLRARSARPRRLAGRDRRCAEGEGLAMVRRGRRSRQRASGFVLLS